MDDFDFEQPQPTLRRINAVNTMGMNQDQWLKAVQAENIRARERYPSPPKAQRPTVDGRAQSLSSEELVLGQ